MFVSPPRRVRFRHVVPFVHDSERAVRLNRHVDAKARVLHRRIGDVTEVTQLLQLPDAGVTFGVEYSFKYD